MNGKLIFMAGFYLIGTIACADSSPDRFDTVAGENRLFFTAAQRTSFDQARQVPEATPAETTTPEPEKTARVTPVRSKIETVRQARPALLKLEGYLLAADQVLAIWITGRSSSAVQKQLVHVNRRSTHPTISLDATVSTGVVELHALESLAGKLVLEVR